MIEFYGQHIDAQGRCEHYNGPTDIVANKCAECQLYYACYQCHDALEKHKFSAISMDDPSPVLCGFCRHTLTFDQYQQQFCVYCGSGFNPKCSLHSHIYFTN